MQTRAAQDTVAVGERVAGSSTSSAPDARSAPGLEFPRYFSRPGVDPFDEVEWELRAAIIGNEKGQVVFEQRDVEMPAVLVPAGHQHRRLEVLPRPDGHAASASARSSSSSAASSHTITEWARRQHYFRTDADLQAFSDELKHLLVYQKGAFNSPVWFNCGFEKAPQCSACFINSVSDTMDSILTLARTEGMLFKFGSGTGIEPVADPLVAGAAGGRRHGVGTGLVHEGLRRVRRRHQVGRQDAACGQDGDPQRRSSRHRRVHQLQGRGREEGVGADRCRLRRLVHRHGVQLGLLPELEQLACA